MKPRRSSAELRSSVNSSSSWSMVTMSRTSGWSVRPSALFFSAAIWLKAPLTSSAAPLGFSRRRRPTSNTVLPSARSSGSASLRINAAARPSNTSPAASAGRSTARRQRETPGMAPCWTRFGTTPARTRDDLPLPLIPSTSTNARPAAAWSRSAFTTSPTACARPKKIAACSNSKAERPRKGDPEVQWVKGPDPSSIIRRSSA